MYIHSALTLHFFKVECYDPVKCVTISNINSNHKLMLVLKSVVSYFLKYFNVLFLCFLNGTLRFYMNWSYNYMYILL